MKTLLIQKLSNSALAPKYTMLLQREKPDHVVIERDDFILFRIYVTETANILGIPEQAKWMYEQIQHVEMTHSRDERRTIVIEPSKEGSLRAFVDWFVSLSIELPLHKNAASAAQAIKDIAERTVDVRSESST